MYVFFLTQDLKPGNILKDQERYLKIEPQLSPLPKHKEQQAITSVNIQVPPQPALGNVVPSTPNAIPNSVLHEETLQSVSITSSPPATLSTAPQLSSLSSTSLAQPQFAYGDINVLSTTQLSQHLTINSQVSIFLTFKIVFLNLFLFYYVPITLLKILMFPL